MEVQLIVDSPEFWKILRNDILQAKKRVWLQTMSFEGDSVGQQLSEAMLASKASDRRFLIDKYSNYVTNDQFLYSPRST